MACGSDNSGQQTGEDSVRPQSASLDDRDVEEVDLENAPRIHFTNKRFNYGEIYHAEKITHDYVFTNAGESDLVISGVRASCGCTQPTYPMEPVAPGDTGVVSVLFNSVGKQGATRATIRVRSNDPAEPEVVLRLVGRVLVKPREEQ